MEFVDHVGPHIAHLHLVDATGTGSEGIQIGDGDVDFQGLKEKIHQIAPNATFIPETWQGHENSGEGFWQALERLEKYGF